jgi:hypothetical protein
VLAFAGTATQEIAMIDPQDHASQGARRLLTRLCCPKCHRRLDTNPEGALARCARCAVEIEISDTRIRSGGFTQDDVQGDWLNTFKEQLKRKLGTQYQLAIDVISPVYPGFLQRSMKTFLAQYDLDTQLVADFGSGPMRHHPKLICCDGMNYQNVDLVTDLAATPLMDGSLDALIIDPQAHVREMRRVLKKDGCVFCFIPFIQAFHASPYDYQRYTASGIRELFKDFDVTSVEPAAGPTSAFVWVLQEWLAMVLSFGSKPLYKVLLPMTHVLSPLKYMDIALRHHPAAVNLESGFLIRARKRD